MTRQIDEYVKEEYGCFKARQPYKAAFTDSDRGVVPLPINVDS